MNEETSSEYSSSSEFEFLSSTDPSKPCLLEREVKKRTYPILLAPIPGPKRNSTKFESSGSTASEALIKLLTEFDHVFMKYKADVGECKIAKHLREVVQGALPHREGARRMSPEKNKPTKKFVTCWHLARSTLRHLHGQVVSLWSI